MTWVLLATGLTGGLTLAFIVRRVQHWLYEWPSAEVYFSPCGGCTETVVREVRRARREVLVQAYALNSPLIAQELIEAKARGVNVSILLDRINEEAASDLPLLLEEGLAPLIDAEHPIAHNHVLIIDRNTVLTGSFSFTPQAETDNAENLLVLRGHPHVARLYAEAFSAHKAHGQVPKLRLSTLSPEERKDAA
jgi:phosphatidylserine/phosphatidylglycerophosphate/cardiolipin synthase-like enzyme